MPVPPPSPPAPDPSGPPPRTTLLLQDWHEGGDGALAELLDRHLDFVRQQVQRLVTERLLQRIEVEDLVQETARQILRYTPRFQVRDGEHFRALLARMVRGSISESWKYITAMRRDMSRDAQLRGDSVLSLVPEAGEGMTPSQLVSQEEEEAWVRLGIEMLREQDRLVILMREWEERSFVEIGQALGIDTDAARMRHRRALARLHQVLESLRAGEIPAEEQND